jgi:hypothetical protein
MKLFHCFLLVLSFVLAHTAFAQDGVGVALEYDTMTVFTVTAGTTVPFALVARDEALRAIEDWDHTGEDLVLTVSGSHAETDSSTRSWNDQPQAFTWLKLLLNDSLLTIDSSFIDNPEVRLYCTIPRRAFTLGRATLTFTQSGVDKDIILSIAPRRSHLAQQSPLITVLHAPHDNYLVEITSPTQGPDKVFLLRRYEIVVLPRDRYLNWISDETIGTRFTARFPDEFDKNPGGSDVFSGQVFIRGMTNYYIASRIRRMDFHGEERQRILLYNADDSTHYGETNLFQVLDHAPNPFSLRAPLDQSELYLMRADDLEQFTWTRTLPPDPYTDIQISRFNPVKYSDDVTYRIRLLDQASLTRSVEFASDNDGKDTSRTFTHKQLGEIIDQLSQLPNTRNVELVWYVEATDGLYVTESTPPYNDMQDRPGYRLRLTRDIGDAVPELNARGFYLHQNYPNPFNPSTQMQIELPHSGYCRMRVFNLIGEEVAVLHDGILEAGKHSFAFEGSGLPSGVYTYRLETEGATLARSMLLLRK